MTSCHTPRPQLYDCDWMASRGLWPCLPHARILKDALGGSGRSTSRGATCTLWCRQALTRLTRSLEVLEIPFTRPKRLVGGEEKSF